MAVTLRLLIVLLILLVGLPVHRKWPDSDRAREIGAERCQQKEFSLRLHACLFGQISPQMALRQQI